MASDEPCLIASKSAVRGQISGKQDLIVEGRVEGRIGLESHLTIEESGSVEADNAGNRYTGTYRLGGSLNVNNGGFNPALTIMALGYWVGEYIAKEWKGGGRFRA